MSEQPKQSDETRLGTETVFDDDTQIDLQRYQFVPKFDQAAIDRVHASYHAPLEKPPTREAIALKQLTMLKKVREEVKRNEDKDFLQDDYELAT